MKAITAVVYRDRSIDQQGIAESFAVLKGVLRAAGFTINTATDEYASCTKGDTTIVLTIETTVGGGIG